MSNTEQDLIKTHKFKKAAFWKTKSFKTNVRVWSSHIFLCLFAIFFLAPFLWGLIGSFKSLDEMYEMPPKLLGSKIRWENYSQAFTALPFGRFMFNSFSIVFLNMLGVGVSCTITGYAFARAKWKGRDFFFYVLLSSMMLPGAARMVPMYQVVKMLDWLDTYKPMTIPHWLGLDVFYTFLMRQYFRTIPKSLEEAARIDGCSSFRIFSDIMVPLARPAIATVMILLFISNWQNFVGPLMYLSTYHKYTIAIGLRMFQDASGNYTHLLMAASMITLIPVLIVFFLGQKYFVKGIVISGSKG
ncbi:MAG: carbohydrate ABC transporter permease [Elusimicrobiota bacterium]